MFYHCEILLSLSYFIILKSFFDVIYDVVMKICHLANEECKHSIASRLQGNSVN